MRDGFPATAPQEANPVVPWLSDRWLALRDKILASEKFQRHASSFPLSRLIARRRARDLFDLCAGFVYSQVLLACVELSVFRILLEEPSDVRVIARRIGLGPDACARLLNAAVSLRLLENRRDGRYGLGPLGAALVGNPGLIAMIEHHRHLYADLRDPVALLQGNREGTNLGRYWPYAEAERPETLSGEQIADYSALMSLSQPIVADEVLDAYPFGTHRCLLDVGGGVGAFLIQAAERFPQLKLMLFDLPAVVERAKGKLAEAGLATKSQVCGGDFFTDALPRGADVISLVRVVLDHDDQKVLTLLRSARRALNDNGTLLIAEQLSDFSRHEPMGAAYFGFYLMAMGRGRARTRDEIAALLKAAGFHAIKFSQGRRVLRTGIVTAQPAE